MNCPHCHKPALKVELTPNKARLWFSHPAARQDIPGAVAVTICSVPLTIPGEEGTEAILTPVPNPKLPYRVDFRDTDADALISRTFYSTIEAAATALTSIIPPNETRA